MKCTRHRWPVAPSTFVVAALKKAVAERALDAEMDPIWTPSRRRTTVATGTTASAYEHFESGNTELVGADVSGGSEVFDFTAEYRPGDSIRGSYTPAGGSPRSFRGWACTGFERGGSTAAVAGLWSPVLGNDADLPGELEPGADGDSTLEFSVEAIQCDADGVLAQVNPAFAVYEAAPALSCLVLQWSSRTNGRSRWGRCST